mgnify:CR=1 FL=1
MTTFRSALRSALTEAVGIPASSHNGSVRRPAASSGSIQRQDGGYIVELVSPPILECPHCGKALPRPQTRRRRLVQVVAGGRVLSVEIEA